MLVALAWGVAAAGAEAEPAREAVPSLERVDRELAEIAELLDAAYFRTALSVSGATRELLEEVGAQPAVEARRARLEVLAATAELALGQRARARGSLERALRAEPALTLDASRVSPRLVELLAEARGRLGDTGWRP